MTSSSSSSHWLIDALHALGHPNPESVKDAYRCNGENSDDTDLQLILLTLWLEDRIIRLWYVNPIIYFDILL